MTYSANINIKNFIFFLNLLKLIIFFVILIIEEIKKHKKQMLKNNYNFGIVKFYLISFGI